MKCISLNAYFKLLFEKGLSSFWDKKGELLKKEEYIASLKNVRQDNSKFQSIEGNIEGEDTIDKLDDDFSIFFPLEKIVILLALLTKLHSYNQ